MSGLLTALWACGMVGIFFPRMGWGFLAFSMSCYLIRGGLT